MQYEESEALKDKARLEGIVMGVFFAVIAKWAYGLALPFITSFINLYT